MVIEYGGNQTIANFIDWCSNAPSSSPGVPELNTLERVVCAALADAYPKQAGAVHDWLRNRPSPPERTPKSESKSHAGSYMAGWYPEWGSEAFFEAVWKDNEVKPLLMKQLDAAEVTPVLHELIAGG